MGEKIKCKPFCSKITKIIVAILAIIAIIVVAVIVFYPKYENGNSYYMYITYDSRLFGIWINVSTNESPEFPSCWYTFYPNGKCYSPMGKMHWYVKSYTENVTWNTLFMERYENHNLTFADVYNPYSFSNNNNTLTLNRTIFGYASNSNWNFTSKNYYRLNETLSVWDVVQNHELYLATFSFDESRWFGVNLTVEGYYNSTHKALVDSMVYSSPMLNIHVDNSSLLRDGVKYYCKGILRDYIETPLNGDFILDVEEITVV